jgi:hypothetical protein
MCKHIFWLPHPPVLKLDATLGKKSLVSPMLNNKLECEILFGRPEVKRFGGGGITLS